MNFYKNLLYGILSPPSILLNLFKKYAKSRFLKKFFVYRFTKHTKSSSRRYPLFYISNSLPEYPHSKIYSSVIVSRIFSSQNFYDCAYAKAKSLTQIPPIFFFY